MCYDMSSYEMSQHRSGPDTTCSWSYCHMVKICHNTVKCIGKLYPPVLTSNLIDNLLTILHTHTNTVQTNESRSKERGIEFAYTSECDVFIPRRNYRFSVKTTTNQQLILYKILSLVNTVRHCLRNWFVSTINLVPELF